MCRTPHRQGREVSPFARDGGDSRLACEGKEALLSLSVCLSLSLSLSTHFSLSLSLSLYISTSLSLHLSLSLIGRRETDALATTRRVLRFAIVDATQPALRAKFGGGAGLALTPENGKELCRVGELVKAAAREQRPVAHPEFDYPGPDILCFRAPPLDGPSAAWRNTVVMSNGSFDWDRPETHTAMLDRSPCGSGTCAVMATLHARGELGLHEPFVHEGILGTRFVGSLRGETTVGGVPAVLPSVKGRAWITQHATVVVDPTDPFPTGFTVGDIWAE